MKNDVIESYIGIPYKVGGLTREGADCYGLVAIYYREQFGIELRHFDRINRDLLQGVDPTLSDGGHRWRLVPLEEARCGDVVALGSARIEHVGIYIGDNQILHCFMRGSATVWPIRRLKRQGWSQCLFYRYDKSL
jgi:cell wall-associated NlpC family hydrolase